MQPGITGVFPPVCRIPGSPATAADPVAAAGSTITIEADRSVPVLARVVVICMATCTIRLVGRRWPGNDLIIAGMAGGTGRVATVISGIGSRAVREDQRRPVADAMAVIALQAGDEMAGGLACSRAAVMAAGAGPCHQTVIETGRYPGDGRMAVITLAAGLYVCEGFAGRGSPVVTSRTG